MNATVNSSERLVTPVGAHSEGGLGPDIEASWVHHCSGLQPEEKRVLGSYVASHYIDYGLRLLIGSGTTLNILMDQIIEYLRTKGKPFDLSITSTNMHVIESGRDAKASDVELFQNMQLSLVGGRLQIGLRSLVGEFAVAGVESRLFYPDLVIFGAIGVFVRNDDIDITYQFEEELPVQCSFGRRPTDHRILLFDHSKLGRRGGWTAGLGIENLLKDAHECSLITTLPPPEDPHRPVAEKQIKAFKALLPGLATDRRFTNKELRLVLLDMQNKREEVFSLSGIRQTLQEGGHRSHRSARGGNGSAEPRGTTTPT